MVTSDARFAFREATHLTSRRTLSATTYLVCAKSAPTIARVRAVADLLVADLEEK